MLILHCFTQLICVGFCLNMLVCHLRLFPAIVVMPGLCTNVWGGDIKIGARFCWGVFVLVLSNIYDGVLVPRLKIKKI